MVAITGAAPAEEPAAAFFFNNSDLPLAIFDGDWIGVLANPAWLRLLPPLSGDFVGASIDAIVPEQVSQHIRLKAEQGEKATGPRPSFKMTGPDGQVRWLAVDAQSAPGRTLVTLIDVTKSRLSAAAIEAARRTRDLVMHEAGVFTWRFDPDRQMFDFTSDSVANPDVRTPTVANFKEGMIRQVSLAAAIEHHHPDDHLVESEIRERLTREGGAAQAELRVKREGGYVHLRVHFRSGARLPSGRFEMYGLSQPITDLAQARDEADANARRLKIALNAARGGVFEVDYRSGRLCCSPEFVELVGCAPSFDEFVESRWPTIHPEDLALLQEQGTGLAGAEPVEIRALHAGGERWVRIYIDITRDEALTPLYGVGLALDIDERKRQELAVLQAEKAAQAATEAKSEFLASVSHEIRTPMNGVVGVLHLLKNEPVSDLAKGLLNEALACSSMLSQLIDDILDFSKIEAGKLELSPEAADPVQTLQGVLDLLRPQAEGKDIYLTSVVEPDMEWVHVDPVRLRQCLFNLIGNAVKFTLRGGVEVRLGRSGTAGRPGLRFEVHDTGIGISADGQRRLFDRFERGDASTTRSFTGAGLGLAISRKLAQMMGGDVGCESVEGKGSVFWLEIDAPPANAQPQGAAVAEGPVLGGLQVLLVDDNHTNRLVGSLILESLGAEVVTAPDGQAAVEVCAPRVFDVILMDINMPGMDGLEATRRIRAQGGGNATVPIAALTANAMAHQHKQYLAAGMDGVIAKPFSPTSLLVGILQLTSGLAEDQPSAADRET